MIAPIFCRTQMRSSISGSTAALDSSVTPSASTAVSSTCSVAPTDGYGSLDLAAAQPLRGLQVLAVRALLDGRAELAQHVEVEVDRPAADVAAAQARDERVAEPVQQRAAEQDRDPRGARVRVDVGDVGALHVRRVEHQLTWLLARAAPSPRAAGAVRAPRGRPGCRGRCAAGWVRCRAARRPWPWVRGSSHRGHGSRPRAGFRRGQAVRRRVGHGSRVPRNGQDEAQLTRGLRCGPRGDARRNGNAPTAPSR